MSSQTAVWFQGIAYTTEPLSMHASFDPYCPPKVRSMNSLFISTLQPLHTALTKRLYGKSAPLNFTEVREARERVWNLLLMFHDRVNVKMDRTGGDSFGDMKITISRKAQAGGEYGPVPDAPDTFETEIAAREWVHANRETSFDYLVILTCEQPVQDVSVSQAVI